MKSLLLLFSNMKAHYSFAYIAWTNQVEMWMGLIFLVALLLFFTKVVLPRSKAVERSQKQRYNEKRDFQKRSTKTG